MEVFAERYVGTRWEGRFDITSVIGGGGMGTVYAAMHAFTGREVALKLLHPDVASSPAARERFLREARAPASIEHPAIVPVVDAGIAEDGTPYLAFERLYGRDLGAALRAGAVDGARLVAIVLELLDVLERAHAAGMVHRDIKPENVFLEERALDAERVRLLDFGITRPALEASEGSLTHTGSLVGTPDYLSPEQAEGLPIDRRSDLFSVGGLLFYGLTGQRAFAGENALRRLVALLTTEAPPIRSLRAEVPEDLAAVIARALRHRPEERFASAAEMAQALRALAQPIELSAVPPSEPALGEAAPVSVTPLSLAPAAPPVASLLQPVDAPTSSAAISFRDALAEARTLPVARPDDEPGAGPGPQRHAHHRRMRAAQWALIGAALAILTSVGVSLAPALLGGAAWSEGANLEGDVSASSYEPRVVAHPERAEFLVVWSESGAVKVRRASLGSRGLFGFTSPAPDWWETLKLERRGDPVSPAVGVDAKGRVLVVWALTPRGSDRPERGVWYSVSDDWEKFSDPVQLYSGDTYGGIVLAMSPTGRARIVFNEWIAPDTSVGRSSSMQVLQTAFFDGTRFSQPRPVMPAGSFADDVEATLAIDGQDRGLIAWTGTPLFAEDVWMVEFRGDQLGQPEPLDPGPARDYTPSIAMNADGEALIAWARYPNRSEGGAGTDWAAARDMELWAARYLPGAGITSQGRVARFGTLGWPDVAIDAKGDAWIAYTQGDGDVVLLQGRADGRWDEDPTLLARTRRLDNARLVHLEGAPDGTLVALWGERELAPDPSSTDDTGEDRSAQAAPGEPPSARSARSDVEGVALFAAVRPAGGSWEPAQRLHGIAGLESGGEALALGRGGRALAAWTYRSNARTELPVRQVHASARFP